MAVTAKLRYLRIAPRKVRLVADLIRGKTVGEAQTVLNFIARRAASPLLKLLKQAIANAKNNFQLSEDNLYISKITVDEGPKLKRWMPRARGQVSAIQKKTSHITLILDEISKKKKRVKKIKKVEKIKRIKILKKERKKLRPEIILPRPTKVERGIKRVFRRKSV